MVAGSQDQSQALTESGKAFTADPFEHIGVTLTGLAEELIELDDGCTETGKLEASLRRPWTWTVRNALSWNKHDTEREVQEQGKEPVKSAA